MRVNVKYQPMYRAKVAAFPIILWVRSSPEGNPDFRSLYIRHTTRMPISTIRMGIAMPTIGYGSKSAMPSPPSIFDVRSFAL